MLIIPDTNFLIYITKYKLWHELDRLYGKYKFLILPEVIYELDKLSKKTGKDKKIKNKEFALLALELINKLEKKIKKKKGYADKSIFKTASMLKKNNKNFIIATMDRAIARKIKKQGIRILIIRQKKYLKEV